MARASLASGIKWIVRRCKDSVGRIGLRVPTAEIEGKIAPATSGFCGLLIFGGTYLLESAVDLCRDDALYASFGFLKLASKTEAPDGQDRAR